MRGKERPRRSLAWKEGRNGDKKDCFPEVMGGTKWSPSGSAAMAIDRDEN